MGHKEVIYLGMSVGGRWGTVLGLGSSELLQFSGVDLQYGLRVVLLSLLQRESPC